MIQPVSSKRLPLVIAHRGASALAPENTIAAFTKAVELGVDMIELDVHATRDGHLVVIHDETVERTAKGGLTGRVRDLTLDEIRSLDAGSWKGAQFAGEKVPTLEETLSRFAGKTRFLIELKVSGVERQVVQVIEETGTVGDCILQSFDPEVVRVCRNLLPHVPTGLLYGDPRIPDSRKRAAYFVSEALKVNAPLIGVHYLAVDAEFLRHVRHTAIGHFVWTVDDPAEMRRLIEAGVDGIITNRPELLVESAGSSAD